MYQILCRKNKISVLYIYKQLYNNKSFIFDLTNEGNKCVCKNDRGHTVPNILHVIRTCKYIRNLEDKIYTN